MIQKRRSSPGLPPTPPTPLLGIVLWLKALLILFLIMLFLTIPCLLIGEM